MSHRGRRPAGIDERPFKGRCQLLSTSSRGGNRVCIGTRRTLISTGLFPRVVCVVGDSDSMFIGAVCRLAIEDTVKWLSCGCSKSSSIARACGCRWDNRSDYVGDRISDGARAVARCHCKLCKSKRNLSTCVIVRRHVSLRRCCKSEWI